jgi:glyoxylase-like metal-dependent hydrolase (beta-lactamase superfamily II)
MTQAPAGRTSFTTVAEGVHRVSEAFVNFYLVESADGLTLVDSGLPAMWKSLEESVRALGHAVGDIKAVVLTHAHFDHLGLAHRLHSEFKVPVWVHGGDSFIARHPYRYQHEKSRFVFALAHPRGFPVLASMTKAGALRVRGVDDLTLFPASPAPCRCRDGPRWSSRPATPPGTAGSTCGTGTYCSAGTHW